MLKIYVYLNLWRELWQLDTINCETAVTGRFDTNIIQWHHTLRQLISSSLLDVQHEYK